MPVKLSRRQARLAARACKELALEAGARSAAAAQPEVRGAWEREQREYEMLAAIFEAHVRTPPSVVPMLRPRERPLR